MKGKLSRKIEETLGVKQGNINSSDDYKIYINPALVMFYAAQLGVWIGDIIVSVTGVADDLYLMSTELHMVPKRLRSLLWDQILTCNNTKISPLGKLETKIFM